MAKKGVFGLKKWNGLPKMRWVAKKEGSVAIWYIRGKVTKKGMGGGDGWMTNKMMGGRPILMLLPKPKFESSNCPTCRKYTAKQE
jgi:hypothetical protein